MATLKEQDIVLTSKDASGNPVIQMPITRAANVEDLTATCLPLSGGNLSGNLTVQSKNVVRSVNGTFADANGNVTISASKQIIPSSQIQGVVLSVLGTYTFQNAFLGYVNAFIDMNGSSTATISINGEAVKTATSTSNTMSKTLSLNVQAVSFNAGDTITLACTKAVNEAQLSLTGFFYV